MDVRAVLIKGPSQYDGTRTFIDEAAKALEKRGYVAEVVDVAGVANPWEAMIAAAERGPAHLVFTVNILGEARHPERGWLSELFSAPHVVWHVDYLLGQAARLDSTLPTTPLLVIDPTQAEGLRAVYGPERFPNVRFCPHAAIGEAAPEDADTAAFVANRPIPILWCGSFQKPGGRPWAAVGQPAHQMLEDAFDLAMGIEWMPPLDAVDHVMRARGLDLADPAMKAMRLAASLVDIEVRVTRRFEFVKAMAKTGLPLRICGAGWEKHLYRFKNVAYEGVVSMPRAAELMQQSRIVLNTNGNFGGGSHERPLSALLAGAAVFSDYSRFYGEAFEEGREMALFRWKALDEGMDTLRRLAASPADAHAIARAGKAKVVANHTWDQRIDHVIQAADAVR
jgi:hypothetical protein